MTARYKRDAELHTRASEREMKMNMMMSRKSLIEREKAMEAARNPGVSKFGDCLLTSKAKTDKMLVSNIRKINSEIKRMQLQVNQKMKLFVKNSGVLNHDPLLLVERPPSPEIMKKAYVMKNFADPNTHYYPELEEEGEHRPSYMRQLRSKAKTPSTLTTIDAFTVKSRKKKNVWEDVVEDKKPPVFLSTVRPSVKLTKREISDLQKGYEFHKPRLDNNPQPLRSPVKKSPPPKRINRTPKHGSSEDELEENDGDVVTFITQMADAKKQSKTKKESPNIAENDVEIRSVTSRASTSKQSKPPKSPVDELVRNEKYIQFMVASRTSASGKTKRKKTKTVETKVTY